MIDKEAIGRIFREEYGRSLAALISLLGDIDVAEDALQEACTLALGRWPVEGPPRDFLHSGGRTPRR
ncbi:hypothetical protein [Sinosporangium siamense]|uniref:RNA polymerase sigma-70 region 2 domain-containing protein n=1 Tax=Sinosporangium siamense TaxID=1367973 RepID=A0A919RNM1_9ACTN|nr:hypothetical protein [Sinosporangium siamense]GII97087.1 hypothetical protein Ssi02_73180 [Sinosporangium siamense]